MPILECGSSLPLVPDARKHGTGSFLPGRPRHAFAGGIRHPPGSKLPEWLPVFE
jgi:hypothetical protein